MNLFVPFLRRLITILFGSILLLLSVFVILTVFGWYPFFLKDLGGLSISFDPYITATFHRVIWTLCASASALIGLGLIWLGVRFDSKKVHRYEISAPRYGQAFGDVSVTVGANGVRSLIAYIAEDTDQVRQCDPTIILSPKGWQIACRVYIAPEASLPEVVDVLKKRIRQELEHHTGLPVIKLKLDTELLPLGVV